MKKLYWRPSKVPRVALFFTSFMALAFITTIEFNQVHKQQPYYQEKIQAATIMKNGMEILKKHREKHLGPINKKLDPAGSGLIGLTSSSITSSTGFLNVKQTTINPNWGAVMVMMLTQLKVKSGDYIAIGASGSFPALNIATLAAIHVLGLKAVIISSAAASNWGANYPELTWLDMEKILFDEGLISSRTVAASLGGSNDAAEGISEAGIAALKRAINRSGARFLSPQALTKSVEDRMAIYREFSGGNRIAAYINIGGGIVSVGSREGKKLFLPGVNKNLSRKSKHLDGVMNRFQALGTPVIHLSYIDKIAEEYGLPKGPNPMQNVGEGDIFETVKYNKILAGILLFLLLAIMYTMLRLDIGYRIFGVIRKAQPVSHPEPMI